MPESQNIRREDKPLELLALLSRFPNTVETLCRDLECNVHALVGFARELTRRGYHVMAKHEGSKLAYVSLGDIKRAEGVADAELYVDDRGDIEAIKPVKRQMARS